MPDKLNEHYVYFNCWTCILGDFFGYLIGNSPTFKIPLAFFRNSFEFWTLASLFEIPPVEFLRIFSWRPFTNHTNNFFRNLCGNIFRIYQRNLRGNSWGNYRRNFLKSCRIPKLQNIDGEIFEKMTLWFWISQAFLFQILCIPQISWGVPLTFCPEICSVIHPNILQVVSWCPTFFFEI